MKLISNPLKRASLIITSIGLACATSLAQAKEFTSATVTQTINEVNILEQRKKARAAKLKDVLNTRNILQTGRRSRAELTFPDKSITRLGSNTSFGFAIGITIPDAL